jgi:adenylylsulfate kinase-like enzyme
MTDRTETLAVLVTGIYGTGKSSVIEEMASLLEERGTRYAAMDLDWLGWFDPVVEGDDHEAGWPVKLKNIAAVASNYHDAGIRRFLMAGSIGTSDKVDELRATIEMPLFVVRLTLPIEEIERRLGPSVTAGRDDDLAVARRWSAQGWGEGIGDLVMANDRPIRDIALEVLDSLPW